VRKKFYNVDSRTVQPVGEQVSVEARKAVGKDKATVRRGEAGGNRRFLLSLQRRSNKLERLS